MFCPSLRDRRLLVVLANSNAASCAAVRAFGSTTVAVFTCGVVACALVTLLSPLEPSDLREVCKFPACSVAKFAGSMLE